MLADLEVFTFNYPPSALSFLPLDDSDVWDKGLKASIYHRLTDLAAHSELEDLIKYMVKLFSQTELLYLRQPFLFGYSLDCSSIFELDRFHDLIHHLILFDYECACLDHLIVVSDGIPNSDKGHVR